MTDPIPDLPSHKDGIRTKEFFVYRKNAGFGAFMGGFGGEFAGLFLAGMGIEASFMAICSLSEIVGFMWGFIALIVSPYILIGPFVAVFSVRRKINRLKNIDLTTDRTKDRSFIQGLITGAIVGFIPGILAILYIIYLSIETGSMC